MSITHDIGYVMAAMEDAGCSSTKLLHSGSRQPSKSTAREPSSESKATEEKDTPKAKTTEAHDESVRYSTDSESIIKDTSPSSPPKKSLRSSLLKKVGRRA